MEKLTETRILIQELKHGTWTKEAKANILTPPSSKRKTLRISTFLNHSDQGTVLKTIEPVSSLFKTLVFYQMSQRIKQSLQYANNVFHELHNIALNTAIWITAWKCFGRDCRSIDLLYRSSKLLRIKQNPYRGSDVSASTINYWTLLNRFSLLLRVVELHQSSSKSFVKNLPTGPPRSLIAMQKRETVNTNKNIRMFKRCLLATTVTTQHRCSSI